MQDIRDKSAAEAQGRHRLEAIGFMIAAVVLFSALDATAKYLVTREGLPVVQVVWARFIVQFSLLLLMVPAFGVMSARALFTTNKLGRRIGDRYRDRCRSNLGREGRGKRRRIGQNPSQRCDHGQDRRQRGDRQ